MAEINLKHPNVRAAFALTIIMLCLLFYRAQTLRYSNKGIMRVHFSLAEAEIVKGAPKASLDYQESRYSDAIVGFASIETNSPQYIQAQFLMGNAYLLIDSPQKAVLCFLNVLKQGESPLAEEAAWNLALSYLGASMEDMAQSSLEKIANTDGQYQEKAKAALEDLTSFWRKLPGGR